jgi:hypothetical protein
MIPNLSSYQYGISFSTQVSYDFQFKHVSNQPKNNTLLGVQPENPSLSTQPPINTQFPTDISFLSAEISSDDHHQITLSPSKTNRSLFVTPR